MKNVLVILLAMFFGMSVVGCAHCQNKEENSTDICQHLYNSSIFIDDVRTFYEDIRKRMRDDGYVLTYAYDTRGKLFNREVVKNGRKYVVSVEITAAPKVYDFNVLTYSPYIDFSVKRLGRFGGKDVCLNWRDSEYRLFLDRVGYIVDRAANLSTKKEPFVEIIDIPVGGQR
jgi:hypothetical protein